MRGKQSAGRLRDGSDADETGGMMPTPKAKTTQEVALTNWGRWLANDNGKWEFETIRTASIAHTAERMERLVSKVDTILTLLLGLGQDGLHEVIREAAREAREKERRRVVRRRKRRQAKRGT